MQKKYKQLYFHLIFGIMLGCLLCMSRSSEVYAVEGGSCGEKLTWNLSGNVLEISGSGDMMDYSDGAFPAWYGVREEIQVIELPSGLTSIGDYAFLGCENVTSISIPSGVTDIGKYAFAQCKGLLKIDLGGNVEKIGKGAFQECESLASILFTDTLKTLESKAFYRCYGIQTVTVPSSVESMGSSVFAYCTGLVRANVNIPMTELPRWTFYGCSSLTDISLAENITSVGEYAFHNCENLNGIYTESKSTEVAVQIEESIKMSEDSATNSFVADYDMPNNSSAAKSNEDTYTETKIVETGNSTITIESRMDSSSRTSKKNITISVTIKDDEDWENLVKEIEHYENYSITVAIYLSDNKIDSDRLRTFAGKNIILQINTDNGIVWELDMLQLSEDSFSGKYNLSVSLTQMEANKTQIASDQVYQLKFSDRTSFNTTIGIKIGRTNALITLYEKKNGSYEIITTMVVDQDGYAWFSLSGVDKRAKYYIGLNVEGIALENAIVPQTMYEQYGLDENNSYLMDAEGMQYRITGRSSRWGITGKQFAIYVGVAIAATVLIVGFVMITLNIIKKSKEKYERMAEEEALIEKAEEEALRMEIMKELLGESDDSIKKE